MEQCNFFLFLCSYLQTNSTAIKEKHYLQTTKRPGRGNFSKKKNQNYYSAVSSAFSSVASVS